jgi:hypothetical protein
MPLTPEQLELRKNRIGASEIGAVLGIDPHRSPLQLWMDKKGMARQHDAAHLGWGLDVEAAILRNFSRRQGYEVLPAPGSLAHPFLPLVCTPDGLVLHKGRVRETSSARTSRSTTRASGASPAPRRRRSSTWRRSRSSSASCESAEMDLRAGDDEGDLAVSFGGRPPLGYPIPFNEELFGNLAEAAAKFVRDHLETDKPPPLEGDRPRWST